MLGRLSGAEQARGFGLWWASFAGVFGGIVGEFRGSFGVLVSVLLYLRSRADVGI